MVAGSQTKGESMLTLYTFHNSICTQKVFITLAEKELKYEEKLINLFAAEQYDPEYLKINQMIVYQKTILILKRLFIKLRSLEKRIKTIKMTVYLK